MPAEDPEDRKRVNPPPADNPPASEPPDDEVDTRVDSQEESQEEELTPETMAAESRRGDRLLAGMAIGLGLLVAVCQIGSDANGSQFWRHLATGRFIAEQGFWPPAKDVFTYTASEQSWTNLSWLFDLTSYGLFELGGPETLVAIKMLLIGVAVACLLSLRLPGPTLWWSSLAAVTIVAVSNAQMQVAPACVTLVMLALVLWILERHRQGRGAKLIWWLVPLELLWVNLDPRFFVGLLAVGGYLLGELACGYFAAPASKEVRAKKKARKLAQAAAQETPLEDATPPDRYRRRLAAAAGLMLLAALANPYGFQSLAAPWQLRAGQKAEAAALGGNSLPLRSLYGISQWPKGQTLFAMSFWREQIILGLALLAGVSFVLNRQRFAWGWLGMSLAVFAWAATGLWHLPLAAMVLVSVTSLNLQAWSMARFGTGASIHRGWVMFSRGGRVATVLFFFAVAVLGMTGRLRDAAGFDIGFGLAPQARDDVKEMQSVLDRLPAGARAFNMTPAQGDLLAWVAKKPAAFLDTRWELFGTKLPELAAQYDQIRGSLLRGQSDVWKPVFDRHQVDCTILEMHQPRPFINTYVSLESGRQWTSIHMGGGAAVFFRIRGQTTETAEFLARNRFDPADLAYQVQDPVQDPPQGPPGPREFIPDRLWRINDGAPPQRFTEAFNYLQLSQFSNLSLDDRIAYEMLAVRRLRQLISEQPNYRQAYALLGAAYERWFQLEMQRGGLANPLDHSQRLLGLITVLEQSQRSHPDELLFRLALIRWHRAANNLDVMLDHVLRLKERLQTLDTQISQDKQIGQVLDQFPKLESHVQKIRKQVEEAADKPPRERASMAATKGCPRLAIAQLDDPLQLVELDPPGFTMLMQLQLTIGQPAAARATLDRYEPQMGPLLPLGEMEWWRGWVELLDGNCLTAAEHWERSLQTADYRQSHQLLQTSRLLLDGSVLPITESAGEALGNQFYRQADRSAQAGLLWLEAGQLPIARERLRQSIAGLAPHPLRLLVGYYWERLSDETIDDTLRSRPHDPAAAFPEEKGMSDFRARSAAVTDAVEAVKTSDPSVYGALTKKLTAAMGSAQAGDFKTASTVLSEVEAELATAQKPK